jgi:hypothetical protein
MPWISRTKRSSHTGYWLLAITAAVALGIVIGYQQWGTTAAVVSLVEKEMAITQAQIKLLEKRVGAMELKVSSGNIANSAGAIANVQLEEGSYGTQRALRKDQITTSTAEQQR